MYKAKILKEILDQNVETKRSLFALQLETFSRSGGAELERVRELQEKLYSFEMILEVEDLDRLAKKYARSTEILPAVSGPVPAAS